MKSYMNKSTYSPDWLFCIKGDEVSPLNTSADLLNWQNTIICTVMGN